jgi:acyl-CoA reductase-like NAD-dependent aldehyde dehydrogenase
VSTIDIDPAIRVKNPDKLFINGQWVKPSTADKIVLVSPNSEQPVQAVAEGKEADIDRAVAAARAAFDAGPWPRMSHAERAAKMRELAAKLRERAADIAYVTTEQMGALPSVTQMMAAGAPGQLEYYAGLADTYPWVDPRPPGNGQGAAFVVSEAVGVVAIITPWNVPLGLLVLKLAPALLTGCTVILKPAPETPLEAYILAECAEAAGFPPGVINLVCTHREAADYLVRQPGVDKVAFTGSTLAGRRIASVCGERIARVTLELGGKSAAIILDDADPAQVAASLTGSTARLSGQVCAALTRIVVSDKRHDDFVDALSDSFRALRVGYSRDPETQLGPVAMKRQLERIQSYVAKGRDEGATLVTGGQRPKNLNHGYFIEPTIFSGVDRGATIAQEEIFGPVLSVIRYSDEADAVRIANDSIYGLNGAVFTNDAERAYDIMRQVRTGSITQNGFKIDSTLPFGGFKQSGIGREYGVEGLKNYIELKTVNMDRAPPSLA